MFLGWMSLILELIGTVGWMVPSNLESIEGSSVPSIGIMTSNVFSEEEKHFPKVCMCQKIYLKNK